MATWRVSALLGMEVRERLKLRAAGFPAVLCLEPFKWFTWMDTLPPSSWKISGNNIGT